VPSASGKFDKTVREAARAAHKVALTVSATRDNVRVEVRDSGAQGLPVPQPLELDREGGFGLFLIDQLADSWGVENEPSLCVWFEVSTS